MADGLPDFLERAMSDRMKRLSRLGNAVVPDCAQWIGERIMATAE
jgi:site-specific DNA-cytosine methylase